MAPYAGKILVCLTASLEGTCVLYLKFNSSTLSTIKDTEWNDVEAVHTVLVVV